MAKAEIRQSATARRGARSGRGGRGRSRPGLCVQRRLPPPPPRDVALQASTDWTARAALDSGLPGGRLGGRSVVRLLTALSALSAAPPLAEESSF
jgi:hypothetical protein